VEGRIQGIMKIVHIIFVFLEKNHKNTQVWTPKSCWCVCFPVSIFWSLYKNTAQLREESFHDCIVPGDSSPSARVRIKDTIQTIREKLMYKNQSLLLSPEESIQETVCAHLLPLSLFLWLFCLLSLALFPGGGTIHDSRLLWIAPGAKCSFFLPGVSKEWGGAEEKEWSRTPYDQVVWKCQCDSTVGRWNGQQYWLPALYSTI